MKSERIWKRDGGIWERRNGSWRRGERRGGGGAEGTTLAFICGFSLEQQVSLAAGRCECRVFGWL